MAEQTAAQSELATLIVESLNLEDIQPAQIDPDAPLFGGELGLDSIDNPDNRAIFASLRSLAEHVEKHRAAV